MQRVSAEPWLTHTHYLLLISNSFSWMSWWISNEVLEGLNDGNSLTIQLISFCLLSQRCRPWWLCGSEPRGRSPSLVPRWWAAPTSLLRLLWVEIQRHRHSITARTVLIQCHISSNNKKSNVTLFCLLRCWWKLCQLWGLSADGQPATSTPLRMKWQLPWQREVRLLCVCDTYPFLHSCLSHHSVPLFVLCV